MADFNKVMLCGTLAADPEFYVTRSGIAVLTVRLATTEPYMDRDDVRRDRTYYHYVVVVGKRASALSTVLHKGARVFVEGSLRTTTFDGRDGQKRTRTEVQASEVLFAGEGAAAAQAQAELKPGDAPT